MPAPENDDQKEMLHRQVTNLLLHLGLEHRKDTLVGSNLLRGLSGGERKRVTIGLGFASNASLALLDEPTTGLDSTASLEVFKSISTVGRERFGFVAALLQPSQVGAALAERSILRQLINLAGAVQPLHPRAGHIRGSGARCPAAFMHCVSVCSRSCLSR